MCIYWKGERISVNTMAQIYLPLLVTEIRLRFKYKATFKIIEAVSLQDKFWPLLKHHCQFFKGILKTCKFIS